LFEKAAVPAQAIPLLRSLDRSPDPVFVTDRNNRIVFWNRSAEHVLGYTAEEAVGEPCAALLEGCDDHGNRYCSDHCPVNLMAVRNETVRQFGLKMRAKGGGTLLADVSILHLAVPSPDHFLLVHVMRPALRADAPRETPAARTEEPRPPRPSLVIARDSPDARARKLTSREIEVLGMLAAGHPTADIALRLHISTLTARNHVQNILDKLEVHSKAEAVAFAFQKSLI
jgi:DNA-binding CsgD family transcriptional regulator